MRCLVLLALQGLCESKPSDYVAWRILGIPRWCPPIFGKTPVVGFYQIYFVLKFHPEKKLVYRWLRKQWELTSLRQVQHFKMMAMADVRHLLESAWEALGKGFFKAETVRVTLDTWKKGLNSESETVKRRCSCWFQDLLHPIKDKVHWIQPGNLAFQWESPGDLILRRHDLQLNHPTYPPKPTEYGMVCPKKCNTKNWDLGIYYCICLYIHHLWMTLHFSNRL